MRRRKMDKLDGEWISCTTEKAFELVGKAVEVLRNKIVRNSENIKRLEKLIADLHPGEVGYKDVDKKE